MVVGIAVHNTYDPTLKIHENSVKCGVPYDVSHGEGVVVVLLIRSTRHGAVQHCHALTIHP
jgi:hypothetical protein